MMRRKLDRSWRGIAAGVLLAVGIVGASPAFACPNCKDMVAQSGEPAEAGNTAASVQPGGRLGDGFNYAIFLMLGVPYALVGGAGWLIYRSIRKAQGTRAVTATAE